MANPFKDAFERARRELEAKPIQREKAEIAHFSDLQDPTRLSNRPEEGPALQLTCLVSVAEGATFALIHRDQAPLPLLSNVELAGRGLQCCAIETHDEREVVLGLDFGTSSVKVVIGDPALGKAFAVPFCDGEGIGRFLLPSRLYQTGAMFSLDRGELAHRDLKLSLLASPEDRVLHVRLVAFLAFVIRRARGWLFTEQMAVYKHCKIVWRLAVGLPAAQHLETSLSKLFGSLALAAWIMAGDSIEVSEELIEQVLDDVIQSSRTINEVDVTVVPEIAAQIFGFVASNSFDKKASNIYLIADIGAGTIDSSLFHVKPAKGGRWDFEFFTSVVEPNGVTNLHRHRVNWWSEELSKAKAPGNLLQDLLASKWITDHQLAVPNSCLEYFVGVKTIFADRVENPDENFFNQRVLTQVQGKTFWRTWKDNLLSKEKLTNVPFFMCGGGARMPHYQALVPSLASVQGCPWLKAERWVMGVPNDLIADSVSTEDFDRLSVAYGLSRLEVGKIVRALPQPRLVIPPVEIWRDNYIDKDQC